VSSVDLNILAADVGEVISIIVLLIIVGLSAITSAVEKSRKNRAQQEQQRQPRYRPLGDSSGEKPSPPPPPRPQQNAGPLIKGMPARSNPYDIVQPPRHQAGDIRPAPRPQKAFNPEQQKAFNVQSPRPSQASQAVPPAIPQRPTPRQPQGQPQSQADAQQQRLQKLARVNQELAKSRDRLAKLEGLHKQLTGLVPERVAPAAVVMAGLGDIQDPKVLREAIIYHEIFSPPLALRDRAEVRDR
jgi:hypothetical protein